jgi:glycosyltransferase involved in cell wall biosynthesis
MHPGKTCNLCSEMQQLSVVIICKNEEGVIGQTLQSLEGLSDDIIVYDNGSTDNTIELVSKFNVQLHRGKWEGFGKTKNKAIAIAKYDWILSLDADEAVDEELKRSLLQWQPGNDTTVYELAFKNYFGNKYIKHGEWGRDHHIRFFNRKKVGWNDAAVHESLLIPSGAATKRIKGFIIHRTLRNLNEYKEKLQGYAMLGAEKYYKQGKKANWLKLNLSPFFTFANYYFIKLGFLDGREGYILARMTARYTYLKYERLKELNRESGK